MWANTDFLFRGEKMAKQRFSLEFDFEANMGPIKRSVEDFKKSLEGISLPPALVANFQKLFGSLEREMGDFELLTKKGFTEMADVRKAENAFGRISKLIGQLGQQASKVGGMDPQKLFPQELLTKLTTIKKRWAELDALQKRKDSLAPKITKQNEAIRQQRKKLDELLIKQKALQESEEAIAKQKAAAKEALDIATKQAGGKSGLKKKQARQVELEAIPKEERTKDQKQELANLTRIIKAYTDAASAMSKAEKRSASFVTSQKNNTADIEIVTTKIRDLETALTELETSSDISPESLKKLREEAAALAGLPIEKIPDDLDEIRKIIANFETKKMDEATQKVEEMGEQFGKTAGAADKAADGLTEIKDAAEDLDEGAKQVEHLANQVKDFFSIGNSIQLFKRAVTEAFETVKELDKTMTEAAVVTNFSIGDMWDKLPEYSANARELGVSINGMYQATTLYFQQGLKTNEAMALGIETMKMARIAGMESAEATEAMTAALRGFNMELNQTSATRVNDVYSELAAVTAADTEQIATAMSKTASIAANANMEFETTAALLAQIIETTQEAPETAGTAMKTIIARFSEVKSLRDQGLVSGTDTEGEEIDVNKIQTALRTVGISMEGFFAGTEGLDSILLKLAEKWDTLDFETQRYIATMAAGSRQQSRFIAMMSDYGRTTELVGAAQDSAGASQRQFNKTLDSMESKLQKLANAWDEFVMGLANNEILKTGVDILTGLLEGVNALTDGISGDNGLVKSLISLVTVWGALSGGKALLGKGLNWVGTNLGFGQKEAGKTPTKQIVQDAGLDGDKAGQSFGQRMMNKILYAIKGKRSQIQRELKQATNVKLPGEEKGRNKLRLTKTQMSEYDKANVHQYFGKVKDPTDTTTVSLEKLNNSAKDTSISVNDTTNTVEKLGTASNTTSEKTQGLSTNLEKTKITAEGVATGAKIAGGAILGFSAVLGVLAAKAEEAGNEEFAESLSNIASIASVAGTAIMGLAQMMPILSKAATGLGNKIAPVGGKIAAAGLAAQAGWIGIIAIVVAVAGLVALGISLYNQAQKLKDSYQLEELNKQFDELNEAQEEAKDKLKEIQETAEGLKELQSAFDGLVKGSQEWTEALIKNNEKVLELIELYPILRDYLDRGLNGELVIKEEGLKKLEENQSQALLAAQGAKILTSQEIDNKEFGVKIKEETLDIFREYYGAFTGVDDITDSDFASVTGLTPEEMAQLSREAFERGLDTSELPDSYNPDDEWIKLIEEVAGDRTGFAGAEFVRSKLVEMGTIFDQLGVQAAALNEVERARIETMAMSIASSSETISNSQYSDTVADMGAQTYKDYEDKTQEYLDKIEENWSNNLESHARKYAELNSLDYADVIKNIDESDSYAQAVKQQLATNEVNKDWKNSMEDYAKKLEELSTKMDPKELSQLVGLLTDGGLGMQLGTDLETKNISKWLTSLGVPEWTEMITENYQKGKDAMEGAYRTANSYGRNYKNIIEDFNKTMVRDFGPTMALSAEQLTSLVNDLAEVTVSGGDADYITTLIPTLLQGLTGPNLEQAYNTLLTTDWLDQSDIEITLEQLRNLGVEIGGDLPQQIYAATNAVKKFNLDVINEKIGALEELEGTVREKIENGESTFTKDEMLALVNKGIVERDKFVKTGSNEFVYMDETNGILQEIKRIAGEILGEVGPELEEQIAIGEKYEAIVEGQSKNTYQITRGSGETMSTVEYGASDFLDLILEEQGQGLTMSQIQDFVLQEGLLKSFTPEEVKELTHTELVKAIETEYENNYLTLGANRLAQGQDAQDAGTQALYNQIGTDEFSKQIKSTAAYQNTYGLKLTEVTTSGQNWETGEIVFDKGMRSAAITGEQAIEKIRQNQDSGLNSEQIKQLAKDLGIDTNGLTTQQINEEIKKYGDEIASQQDTMDGYIKQHQGLSIAVEELTKQLEEQDSVMANDTAKIKALAINAHSASQKMDKLNEVLSNQSEALKIGDKSIEAYRVALSTIAAQAKQVFGEFATEDFIDENKQLFAQLAEGGAVGEQAYAAIIEQYGRLVLEQEGLGEKADEVAAMMNQAFNSVNPGDAIDLTSLYHILTETVGLNEAAADAVMDAWGFTIEHSTKPAWIDSMGNIYAKKPQNIVTEEANLIVGVKDNSSGSNAPTLTGGGGGGGSSSEYENSYDKLHNQLEQINDTLRERERLERQYQRLLDRNIATAEKLAEISARNIDTHEQEIDQQRAIINGRMEQIEEALAQNPDLQKYVQIENDGFGENPENMSIRIDWEALNQLKDSDTGEQVDKFYSDIDGWLDSIYEAQTAILDSQDAIYEEMLQGKDEYLNLEEQVKEAIIDQRQKEIDKLSEINDSITDTNAKLIESMEAFISKERQARENDKTEEELSNKQRRLAYLQQDTSGANAKEILSLQKEIEEGQQSYTDTLIDQKISELQEQNDKAAEQRQQQIDIMQAQLDKYVKSGEIWKEVQDLIAKGTSTAEGLITDSDLAALLKDSSSFKGLSSIQQMDWLNDTNNQIALALSWLSNGALSTIKKEGETITFTNKDGTSVKGTVGKNGEVIAEDGSIYTDVGMDAYGKFHSSQTAEQASAERDKRIVEEEAELEENQRPRNPYGEAWDTTGVFGLNSSGEHVTGEHVKSVQWELVQRGYLNSESEIDGIYGNKTAQAVKNFQTDFKKKYPDEKMGPPDGVVGPNTRNAFKIFKYETGGLADFTGPAWLDGTKSKPEYVLNADQTKAFFTLVDVLGSLQAGTSKSAEKTGDNTYDIDINVESIGSDYDVEQLANTIKRLINEDARYRNNNAINLMR